MMTRKSEIELDISDADLLLLDELAAREGMSLNGFMNYALLRYVLDFQRELITELEDELREYRENS